MLDNKTDMASFRGEKREIDLSLRSNTIVDKNVDVRSCLGNQGASGASQKSHNKANYFISQILGSKTHQFFFLNIGKLK
jgi:hypothetical protein